MLALLSDEQRMLREVRGRIAGSAGLKNPGDLAVRDRAAAWRSPAQAGLPALRVRDEDGRPIGSGVEVAVVAEAPGAGLVPYLGSAVLATELPALAGVADGWLSSYFTSRPVSVYGGSAQIQKNIIARMLGLPR